MCGEHERLHEYGVRRKAPWYMAVPCIESGSGTSSNPPAGSVSVWNVCVVGCVLFSIVVWLSILPLVTPLSPKWRKAIERRIEDERQLTVLAVGRGARLHPGKFWDLPGTFLFTIYVMTALGFGAPVPQTLWGRSSGLIYALVAVPTHIYLMVNASTCLVVNLEAFSNRLKNRHRRHSVKGENLNENTESPNCSRNSELIKTSNKFKIRDKLTRLLNILCPCRCVPTVAILYFVTGAVAFGVLRSKQPLEVVMFPLEFTTSGGLEHVQGYVRILYGFYVEGAMVLLACSLAILRRHSSAALSAMTETYRLFTVHEELN